MEDQAFLGSNDLAPLSTPPPLPSASCLSFPVPVRRRESILTGETRGRGWMRSQSIRRRESLVLYKAYNTLCFTWTSLKAWMRVSPSSSPLHSHLCSELYTWIWQFTAQWAVHLDMTIYSAMSCTPGFDNLQCSELYTPGYDNSQCSELYSWICCLQCSELYTWI